MLGHFVSNKLSLSRSLLLSNNNTKIHPIWTVVSYFTVSEGYKRGNILSNASEFPNSLKRQQETSTTTS